MKKTYVYIMATDIYEGPVKVGISAYPIGRLQTVSTASPYPVSIFHAYCFESRGLALEAEGAFHRRHAELRMNGEWFDMNAQQAMQGLHTIVVSIIDANFQKHERYDDILHDAITAWMDVYE